MQRKKFSKLNLELVLVMQTPLCILLIYIYGFSIPAVMMLDSFGCANECLNGGSCVLVNDSPNLILRNATYECQCTHLWHGVSCEKYLGPPTPPLEECHNQMRTLLLVFLMVDVVILFLFVIIVLTYLCNRRNVPPAPTPEKLADILYKRLKEAEKP